MPLEPVAELLRFAAEPIRRGLFRVVGHWFAGRRDRRGRDEPGSHHRRLQRRVSQRPDRDPPMRLEWYGALARAAESAQVSCAAMFNECPRDTWVERAIGAGFNLVMLSDAAAPLADLTRRIGDLVRLAHPRDVAVEAELGVLPGGVADYGDATGLVTDPDAAAAFVRETGIDVLAVSVGNVHVLLQGQRQLDLARLAAIGKQVDVPLALHGGTGIESESLRQVVALGVAKVNFGTYLKRRALAAWRAALAVNEPDPHHLLGDGGRRDLMVIGRRAVRDAVLERIETLGCCGRA